MAYRIPLTVDKAIDQNTAVTRFMVDVKKIRGLIETEDGSVLVTIEVDGYPLQRVYVEDSFEYVSEAMMAGDEEDALSVF